MDDLLGARMRQARRGSGLQMAEFLRRAGFSESYARNVENGSRPVTLDVADAYDRVLATGGTFRRALDSARGEAWDQQANLSSLISLSERSHVDLDRRGFVTTAGVALTAMGVRWASALAATRPPAPALDSRRICQWPRRRPQWRT